jgi:hypothetical protein
VKEEEFEGLLDLAAAALTQDVRDSKVYHSAPAFEQRTLEVLIDTAQTAGLNVTPARNSQGFPDIIADPFGVEVKSVQTDAWLTIGNSIFEGTRATSTRRVYVMFGKMGGTPEVRWTPYGDVVSHVRTTHMPRFVLDLETSHPLFETMGISYDAFCELTPEDKMVYVRDYSRGRLGPGERLWWLEDRPQEPHPLPLQVRLYRNLDDTEKVKLRAEGVILNPQVVRSGASSTGKYDDVATYLLTVHGVLCPQVRDLFSAGSAAGVSRPDDERGGVYIQRGLSQIEDALREAAERLDDALFQEYWGEVVPREQRLQEWLRRADEYAGDWWRPSDYLFRD